MKLYFLGQPIPKGLHVRINLETGLTEAKLLEDELQDNKKSALLPIDQPEPSKDETIEPENGPEHSKISKASLEEALKHIKNEDLTPDDEEAIKRVTNKFKKYEDIKKELKHLSLTPKTDIELLRELVKKYENVQTDKNLDSSANNVQLYNLFEDIEYLVHQIEAAEEFITLNGFKNLIYPNFNSTNSKIKGQVLNILGSSVQNNPKIQIHALETGCIDKLLRLLALEQNNDVSSRTLYAISSVLRRFPLAQQQFLKNGGLAVFSDLFENPDKLKIQIRVLTLLSDLITEHNNAIKYSEHPEFQEKLNQYKKINIKLRLKDLKWCDKFSNVLKNVVNANPNDHDSIEKCLNMINLVQDICLTYFNNTEARNLLSNLSEKYVALAETENLENLKETDEMNHSIYFQKMKEIVLSLVDNLNCKTEL